MADSGAGWDGMFADTGKPVVDSGAKDSGPPTYYGKGGSATGDPGGCGCTVVGEDDVARGGLMALIAALFGAGFGRRRRN